MADDLQTPSGSPLSLSGSSLGSALVDLLMADDITPGAVPSYQLCKEIFLYHPLGAKMAEAPINLAQSQDRNIEVAGAPQRVKDAFTREWNAIGADTIIHQTYSLARVYGIASVAIGAKGIASDVPLKPEQYATEALFFNVLDPLNTAGSLVLSQDPNSADFQKPTIVQTQGTEYHRSRTCTVMNESPIYIAYTSSSFGFVGRSVYQRALFPLKSFVQTMITDDMVTRKAGVIIAKMEGPGSIIDRAMSSMMGLKRSLLRQAKTDNVLGIGLNESIETLNMMNLDAAGTFARTNILKNIATAADMPAVLLENETMVSGFGEGAEDAKAIARYIERFRNSMRPIYEFMDAVVQRRAWNKGFYEELQKEYPETYGDVSYGAAFSKWTNSFAASWPSLLLEPESERVKVDDVRLRAIIAVVDSLMPNLDPSNKGRLIEWAADNVADSELLFGIPLVLDPEAITEFLEQQQEQQEAAAEAAQAGMGGGGPPGAAGGPGGGGGPPGGAAAGKKVMPFSPRTGVGQ